MWMVKGKGKAVTSDAQDGNPSSSILSGENRPMAILESNAFGVLAAKVPDHPNTHVDHISPTKLDADSEGLGLLDQLGVTTAFQGESILCSPKLNKEQHLIKPSECVTRMEENLAATGELCGIEESPPSCDQRTDIGQNEKLTVPEDPCHSVIQVQISPSPLYISEL